MLNFLQLLDKYRIILLCLIIILLNPYVSAFEFGIYPSELNFNGKQGEEICNNVKIFSSLNKINIALEDKWAINVNASKNLNEYLVGSDSLKIVMGYERNFILDNKKEISICLKSKNYGKFKGVLFFQALDSSLNIGIWLNANISKNSLASRITGYSIKDSENYDSMKLFLPLTVFNLFLLLMLFFVYSKIKYKTKKHSKAH
ncbi:MAG: hypothetical protein AABW89_04660 [Nanoarchaeota archaeon]